MKKLIVLSLAMFAFILPAIAQDGVDPGGGFALDVGTFTGIVAIISMVVTQIIKVVPAIKEKKIFKILTSVGVGIILCILIWLLNISALLSGLPIWQVLIYGLAAGLSGCGFYDIIKEIGKLFKDKS